MSKNTTRRPVAVLLAVLVICSFAGAPAVAAAGASDSLGDDISGVGSDNSTDDGDSSDDTDDGDDDTDDSDDSTDDDTDDGDDDADDSDDDADDDTDDGDDDTDDTDDTDDSEENLTGVVDETVSGTTETADHATETADGAANVAAYRTLRTAESTAGTTDGNGLDLFYSAEEAGPSSEESTDSEERFSPHEFRTESNDRAADAGTDREDVAVITSGSPRGEAATVLSSGGSQPVPTGASGGAALGLGAVAAAAVVRSTPLLTGSSSSTGAATSGYLSSLLDRVKPFVFPLRYSRYDDSDPLEHDAREQVYEIVNETPGSYLSEVSEQADLPLSTTRHHMKVLEREDLVSGAKLRGKRRFYPAYAEGVELAAALNDDSTASIIDALARLGAASVSDLADDLGRDPSTISHHLQRLEADSIIVREREGRAVMNTLSPEARTALEPETTPRPDEAGEALAD